MPNPICPLCGQTLATGTSPWRCPNGHCFDVARQGYVNLLPVQQKHARHPGDTPAQVAARKRFLDAGFYAPIRDTALALLQPHLPPRPSLLDAGCGEGYYSTALAQALHAELWGVDISKDAVRYAAVRYRSGHWIAASAAHLPFPGGCFDAVLSLFALTMAEEFARVLRPGGLFLQVLAGEEHLLGLKRLIYPALLHRPKHPPIPAGFTLLEERELSFSFILTAPQQIQDLLAMTPHYWRITRTGAEAAAAQETLKDTAQVVFRLFRAAKEPNHAGET